MKRPEQTGQSQIRLQGQSAEGLQSFVIPGMLFHPEGGLPITKLCAKNNKNKHNDGVSCNACSTFI